MEIVYPLLFFSIVGLKFSYLYRKYVSIKKNLSKFCQNNDINLTYKLNFFAPDLPVIENQKWKIVWKKEGKGRSFNHVLKVYFELPLIVPEFKILHKNLLSNQNVHLNWKEIQNNLFCSSKEIQNQINLLEKIGQIQSDYGWGVLEVKNQQAFYTIIAEPYEPEAWNHLQNIILLMNEIENWANFVKGH